METCQPPVWIEQHDVPRNQECVGDVVRLTERG